MKEVLELLEKMRLERENTEYKQHLIKAIELTMLKLIKMEVEKLDSNRFEQQVIPTKANASCENCKYNMSGYYCKIHARYLNRMWAADMFTLKDLGCKQFEQIVSVGSE